MQYNKYIISNKKNKIKEHIYRYNTFLSFQK